VGRTFLSVSSVFGRSLPAAIRAYRRRYPEVDLRLRELGTMLQIDGLREGSVDLGFLRAPGRFDGLTIEELSREPYVAVLPSHHLRDFAPSRSKN
jgi:DNA-binding transcriptional LysR family regulator